jgi:Methylamine utilisation protein MauE
MGFSLLLHFGFASQLSLGIVFLLSVWPKLRQPFGFMQSVIEYKILPAKVAQVFGLLLIPLEAFLVFAFLTGFLTDIALSLATLLLSAFLVAVGINLRRGRKIACACFGNASEQISLRTLVRLLLLLTITILLLAFRSMGVTQVPTLGMMIVDASAFIYLLLTTLLAVFLIQLAAWILSLPELVFLVHNLGRNQPLASTRKAADGTEIT